MARTIPARMTAEIDGDFVVFLIGMRINKPWKPHKWWPVFRAAGAMMRTLRQQRELGMLGFHALIGPGGPMFIQYWRDPAALEHFAREAALPHHPAWRRFNRAVGTGGDVGVWHETYLVSADSYESVYVNMPRFGLAAAGESVPIARKGDAMRERLDNR